MKPTALISTKAAMSAFVALTPTLAFAHGGGDHVHGFLSGLGHPLTGLDHLFAMVAIGVIAVRTGGLGGLAVPIAFVAAMVAGALLGMDGVGLPHLETGVAMSLVAFGAMLCLATPLPPASASALSALFGLFHGNAHGFETPESASGIAYAAGFVVATSALHAAGALSGRGLARWPLTIRAAGIAASLVGLTLATQTI